MRIVNNSLDKLKESRIMTRGWTKTERKELMKTVRTVKASGKPIKCAFVEFGNRFGRKPDSVRNFYYSCLAAADYYPDGITKNEIVVFGSGETTKLVSDVLRLCAQGKSVRGAIATLTGDKKKRLRYQNKFRNLVRAKSPIVFEAMEKQKKSSVYYNPFLKKIVEIERPLKTLVKTEDNGARLAVTEYFEALEKEAAEKRAKLDGGRRA